MAAFRVTVKLQSGRTGLALVRNAATAETAVRMAALDLAFRGPVRVRPVVVVSEVSPVSPDTAGIPLDGGRPVLWCRTFWSDPDSLSGVRLPADTVKHSPATYPRNNPTLARAHRDRVMAALRALGAVPPPHGGRGGAPMIPKVPGD